MPFSGPRLGKYEKKDAHYSAIPQCIDGDAPLVNAEPTVPTGEAETSSPGAVMCRHRPVGGYCLMKRVHTAPEASTGSLVYLLRIQRHAVEVDREDGDESHWTVEATSSVLRLPTCVSGVSVVLSSPPQPAALSAYLLWTLCSPTGFGPPF